MLLGLFDINMPTLYGEGQQAFRQLQEEILRTSSDTSLFAWGNWTWCTTTDDITDCLPVEDDDDVQPAIDMDNCYLFAASPSDFRWSLSVVFTTSEYSAVKPSIEVR